MAFNNRNRFRRSTTERTISCSCGGTSKLSSRRNYPFGKKSKPITVWFYKCKECKKSSFLSNGKGGGK
jgi:hypothetical protein